MNRSNRASIAKETLEILDRGWYEVRGGRRVEIRDQIIGSLQMWGTKE